MPGKYVISEVICSGSIQNLEPALLVCNNESEAVEKLAGSIAEWLSRRAGAQVDQNTYEEIRNALSGKSGKIVRPDSSSLEECLISYLYARMSTYNHGLKPDSVYIGEIIEVKRGT